MAEASDTLLRSLKTGDLVLFARPALARWLPGWLVRRGWSHVALVVRDAEHAEPMIWETAPAGAAGPPVRLRRLAKRLNGQRGRISVRPLNRALTPAQCEKLAAWRRGLEARHSKHTLLDLMGAGEDGWVGGQQAALDGPLPAELVAEGYQAVGLLDRKERGGRAADEFTPRHFAERGDLPLKHNFELGPEIPLVPAERTATWKKLTPQPA
jgi:hypothetical protein